jgi:hypothetical protein
MVTKKHHGSLSVVTATSARQFCGWTDQSGMSCPFDVRKKTWNALFLVCCDVATGLVFKHEDARWSHVNHFEDFGACSESECPTGILFGSLSV